MSKGSWKSTISLAQSNNPILVLEANQIGSQPISPLVCCKGKLQYRLGMVDYSQGSKTLFVEDLAEAELPNRNDTIEAGVNQVNSVFAS